MVTRTLTILLADLVGSSAHVTTVPQEQAVDYLQDATSPIRAIIERYQGVVVKFTGDGYLATFECVASALRAADQIRDHFLRQKHTPTGIALDGVRLVLNCADVTLQDDDVFGDGVAVVSRLEKDVPTNQVYVTRAIHAIADDAEFSFESVGEMRSRGWHRSIYVYQLVPTEANFVDPDVYLLITDLHGLKHYGETRSAREMNQWLLNWGDLHRQATVGVQGRVRQFVADMALVTFSSADDAVQGVISLRASSAGGSRRNSSHQIQAFSRQPPDYSLSEGRVTQRTLYFLWANYDSIQGKAIHIYSLRSKGCQKMKRPMLFLFVAGIVAGLVLTAHIATAQEPELQCSPEDMTAAISSAQGNLTQVQAAIDAGNIASALDLLETSRNELTNAFSQCNGWYFEGEGTDAPGPLTLEGGVYILEYASEVPSGIMAVGMLTIDFENLDEDEFIGDSVMEMRTEAGEFSGRKSIRIDGGRYLISLDATGLGPWTIRLIKP